MQHRKAPFDLWNIFATSYWKMTLKVMKWPSPIYGLRGVIYHHFLMYVDCVVIIAFLLFILYYNFICASFHIYFFIMPFFFGMRVFVRVFVMCALSGGKSIISTIISRWKMMGLALHLPFGPKPCSNPFEIRPYYDAM